MQMTCIVCPNGCSLELDDSSKEIKVVGAKCPRGVEFAKSELINPMRSVTTSVKTTVKGYPVISVRTAGEIKKGDIFKFMKEISRFTLKEKVPEGTVIIENILNSGVNVVTTSPMEENNE